MTTGLSRRQAIALTGASLLSPALGGASTAPNEEIRLRRLGAPAEISPGDAFARNLRALPREVDKMLTGRAVYVDDGHFKGETFGAVVRSPHPHAVIRSIDTNAARQQPGVLAVLTGAGVARTAGTLACVIPPRAYGRSTPLDVDRPILAINRVRHIGDGVACVVAETAG